MSTQCCEITRIILDITGIGGDNGKTRSKKLTGKKRSKLKQQQAETKPDSKASPEPKRDSKGPCVKKSNTKRDGVSVLDSSSAIYLLPDFDTVRQYFKNFGYYCLERGDDSEEARKSAHNRLKNSTKDIRDELLSFSNDMIALKNATDQNRPVDQLPISLRKTPVRMRRRDTQDFDFLLRCFGAYDNEKIGYDDINNLKKKRAKVKLSPREWEESYMRPPRGGEEACKHGSDCWGHYIQGAPNGGFTLAAYVFPDEIMEAKAGTATLPSNQRCIFCLRVETQHAALAVKHGGMSFKEDEVIQIHRNDRSEYPELYMIMGEQELYQGMLDPVVGFCISHYEYQVRENGEAYYKQLIPWPNNKSTGSDSSMNFLAKTPRPSPTAH